MGTTYTTAVGNHHIRRQATAVVRRPGTSTVPDTANLPHGARERRHNGPRAIDGDLPARADGRDSGGGVAAPALGAAAAAAELRGARAQAGGGGAGAVRVPAAVAAGAARGARAAADAGRVGGAGTRDGGAAARGALRGGDADAVQAVGAVARLVDGREGEEREEEGCCGGGETHGCWCFLSFTGEIRSMKVVQGVDLTVSSRECLFFTRGEVVLFNLTNPLA